MLDQAQQTSKATNIVIVLYKINMCIRGQCENTVAHTTHMLTARWKKPLSPQSGKENHPALQLAG
jgi:hypothetical protein